MTDEFEIKATGHATEKDRIVRHRAKHLKPASRGFLVGPQEESRMDQRSIFIGRERSVITGVTSAACRLIGLCLRDRREDQIDEAVEGLELAIDGLERFGTIAGSDIGAEYTIIALKQIVVWMKARDLSTAEREFEIRYKGSLNEFVASMERAREQVLGRSTCT